MCKYNNPYYWENLIVKKYNLWKAPFLNFPIDSNSIFINVSIINYKKCILDNNWASYHDIKALLGFLQYIYIPTAFLSVLNKEQNILTPIASTEEFIEEISFKYKDSFLIKPMMRFIEEIETYWGLSDEECKKSLKGFCRSFNLYWNKYNEILSINLFFNLQELKEYIYEREEEFQEVIKEEIELSKEDFYIICKEIYQNEFIRRNFIEILNNKIGCINY